MVSRNGAGTALVVAGVALFVLTFVVSAALAPTIGDANAGGGSGPADGSDGADDGPPRTLVGSQGGGPGLHEHGSVYLLSGKERVWTEGSADSYFDVTMLDNGSVMAGFMDSGYADCEPYGSPCTRTGFRIIDPEPEPEVVSEYSFPVRTRKNSEVHDVEKLPSGEFLLTDMDRERVITVENGEITWQWNASERYDAPPDPTRTDWLHINDVDRIGDDRYLVSVRNANQLVIVKRGEGVVEVINGDESGDGTGDPAVLKRQHNPQWLGEGAVLVADSENNRIVELHRTDGGDWEVAWTLRGAEGVGFSWPRDADRLPNGNTLITDSANQRIVEVNESGETVWSYRTDYVPYEADRLPHGETVSGPLYNAPDGEAGNSGPVDAGGEVPVLTFLLQTLRTSLPLPFWLSEIHIFVTLVSVGMAGTGAVLRIRD